MVRSLLPPDGPDRDPTSLTHTHLGLEDQAVLDFLRGDYAPIAEAAPADAPHRTHRLVAQPAQQGTAEVIYLPAAACRYAIVQYHPTSVRVVRRVIGLFGDAGQAEGYARGNGYHRYDVVPATAVLPTAPETG
jgi:hypothetical protein